MKTIKTHTGKIYVDTEKKLEFLTVGDYGKENNIKADFLGLTKEINGVANTEVDLSKKWVATISTQKGCPMKCKFCDVPRFGFHGNASLMNWPIRLELSLKMNRYSTQKDSTCISPEWESLPGMKTCRHLLCN